MNVAIRNANDAVSLAQTAEGALSGLRHAAAHARTHAVRRPMRQRHPGIAPISDAEFQQIANHPHHAGTQFNGQISRIGMPARWTFPVGAARRSNDSIAVTTTRRGQRGIHHRRDRRQHHLGRLKRRPRAMTNIDTAIDTITSSAPTTARRKTARVGHFPLQVSLGTTASRSAAMDADYASETASLARATDPAGRHRDARAGQPVAQFDTATAQVKIWPPAPRARRSRGPARVPLNPSRQFLYLLKKPF